MNWTDAYEHVGHSIEVPVKLIHAIGAKGAVFIARLFYWKGKQNDPDGWIYKTKHEMEEETGLARWEQDTCVADLKKKGILETRYERLDHRFYYRINKPRLDAIMGHAVTAKKTVSPSESGNPDFGRKANPPGEIVKPDFAKPEIAISPNLESSCGEVVIPDFAYIKQEITYKEREITPSPVSSEFSFSGESRKPPKNKARPDTDEEVVAYAISIGLQASDGAYMWNHWEGNGFKNNKVAMHDWKAVMRSWKGSGYFPSQKQTNVSRPVQQSELRKRKVPHDAPFNS